MGDPREEAAAVAREARALLEREQGRGRLKFPAPSGKAEATTKRRAIPEPAEVRRAAAPALSPPPPAASSSPAPAEAGEALALPGFETPKRAPLPPPVAPAPAEVPLVLRADLPQDLDALRALVAGCRKCGLCETRTKTVFADGPSGARLLFVGEAPGRDEDAQGVPFVGRAGQLLDKMIAAIEMRREDVYIANILKCRPPDNRTPAPGEVEQCLPYLEQQIALVRPVVLCALGLSAMQGLLGTKATMASMRGKTFSFRGVPLIPTYHPAALLRNPGLKRDAWIDLQRVRDLVRAAA
jgi:uracil-DNA glycosylase family 4